MGFNYKSVGYSTVQDMFDKFSGDIRYHIEGLFDFFDKRMIKALQEGILSNLPVITMAPGRKTNMVSGYKTITKHFRISPVKIHSRRLKWD